MSEWSRRNLLIATAGAVTASKAQAARTDERKKPTLCLFSKPLPFLGYTDLGKALHQIGIPRRRLDHASQRTRAA